MSFNLFTVLRRMTIALCITVALLAVAGLTWLALRNTEAPTPNQQRVEQRLKMLSDLHAANDDVLQHYDWINKEKGIVRIPIERSKELMLQEWKDPAAARSNLMARAAVALAVPEPEPSPYE